MQGGEISSLRELSSVSIRIPSERHGCADGFLPEIFGIKRKSALLVSPPGLGKTTLLRELVRKASESGLRVSLADERGELAACWNGQPQLDVGSRTDVLTGAPKAQSAMLLLRAMNPQVLALDEITDPRDAEVCLSAANCGVTLLASAHADSIDELRGRPVFRELLGIFPVRILIGFAAGKRVYTVEKIGAES
jgi:stage III sporulation protein AA